MKINNNKKMETNKIKKQSKIPVKTKVRIFLTQIFIIVKGGVQLFYF